MKRYSYLIFLILASLVMTGCVGDGPGGDFGYGGVAGYVYIRAGSLAQGLSAAGAEPLVLTQSTPPQGYQPFRGANVRVEGTSRYDITGDDGYFYIGGLSPGWYRLTVNDPNLRFPVVEENVRVNSGRTTWFDRADSILTGIGYYVVIGIDQYPRETRLKGPRDDAIAVYNELFGGNKLAGLGRLLIRDGGSGTLTPTKQNIRASIVEATTLAESSNDYLVIYFSGRTGYDFLRPSDDLSGERWITDEELESWIHGFPGHVTLIVDGAHSESMADGILLQPLALQEKWYTVLASAQKGQEAWHDENLGNGKLSVFTHFLLEGITTRGADSRPYGDITARELYEYTEREMDLYDRTHTRANQVPYLHEGYHGDTVIYRY